MNFMNTYKCTRYKLVPAVAEIVQSFPNAIIMPEYIGSDSLRNLMLKNNQCAVRIREDVTKLPSNTKHVVNLAGYKNGIAVVCELIKE